MLLFIYKQIRALLANRIATQCDRLLA